jgi:transformer-2 protein
MKDVDDEGAVNTGSNLFVTGIHPRLSESDVSRLFDKYGEVENCSIMLDPHTKESRGFGFVKMVTAEQADAAKEGLQGEVIEGRTLSIEKARRARPRTPTPGKYFGPPKRGQSHNIPPSTPHHDSSNSFIGDFGAPRGGGRGGRFDRYDDRRGGGGGGYGGRRDDYRGGSRYDSYDRREYGGRRDRDEGYGSRNIDRYASSGRDDRYSGRGDDRRGGGGGRGGYYDRSEDRGGDRSGYDAPAGRDEPRESYSGSGRDYSSREDRYAR